MEINSYKTALMCKQDSAYTKLIDIKDFPDMGSAPDALEVTTLSDGARRYIAGIDNTSDVLEFTANYGVDAYKNLLILKGQELDLGLWFGGTVESGVFTPTGADGKFNFKGYINVSLVGGSVNTPVEMKIYATPSSAITFTE